MTARATKSRRAAPSRKTPAARRKSKAPAPAAPVLIRHRRGQVRASYDAAGDDDDMARHWANADGLSAASANSAEVRARFRQRARYEAHENNSILKGMARTLANDTIGQGPRLQMLSPQAEANRKIERLWARWATEIGLAEKLRLARQAWMIDGEVFLMLTTNPRLKGPIKLDVIVIEADRIASPFGKPPQPDYNDGVQYDELGYPVSYDVLRAHPGDSLAYIAFSREYDTVPAEQMIHLFRRERPGQVRGVPEVATSLNLFAQRRRFRDAVLAAAETAADFAAVIFSDGPAAQVAPVNPMDTVDIVKRMATTLPEGWKLGQIHAEQPATTYEMFDRRTLSEAARCVNMPYNVAAGDSSNYNYASGRMDHQVYWKFIRVDQGYLDAVCDDRILAAWLDEAMFIPGLIPEGFPPFDEVDHQWFWDGMQHVDPVKESSSQDMDLKNGTTTFAEIYAEKGQDWEAALQQRAKEFQLLRDLDLPVPGELPPNQQPQQPTDNTDTTDNTDQADEEAAKK